MLVLCLLIFIVLIGAIILVMLSHNRGSKFKLNWIPIGLIVEFEAEKSSPFPPQE